MRNQNPKYSFSLFQLFISEATTCICIAANFFWDISVRFLSWESWDFWRRHNHFRRFPKKSEVFRRSPKSSEDVRAFEVFTYFSLQKSEIARKVLSFTHLTHGCRSLHGSELTYFWKLCQARRQQLTFFNQAWEIGPQAWAGVRSKFSTRRRESWQVYICDLWPVTCILYLPNFMFHLNLYQIPWICLMV